MLNDKIFVDPRKLIPDDAEVVFVADLFVEDYVGGAELTSEALIESSPLKVHKLHAKNVNLATLQQGQNKFWIFGNFSQLNPELIPTIIANIKYSVLEYDYKYCRARSPEKHASVSQNGCDCHEQINGKLISAFYYGAQCLWWMSEAQKDKYTTLFPFLLEKDNVVLSSVFDKKTLGTLSYLRDKVKNSGETRKNWIVLGSNSWVKGFDNAKKWCEDNGKEYEVVWNLSYNQVLEKLACAEGFVYLPAGADTCPRMVIEAKLLGCQVQLNDYVQHAKEEWFNTDNLNDIQDYLYSAPSIFWTSIKYIMEYQPSISGYTTTYNCVAQGYPFEQSIRSMLQFCDEVCVVDGGSTDGTIDILKKINAEYVTESNESHTETDGFVNEGRLKVKIVPRDWTHLRHAVFDGMQKAEARKMCTGDFCWQMDSDEVVHEDDAKKIQDMCSNMPKSVDIVSLPVVEYWGSQEKVRVDIQPWKWRLSRNQSYITHGIPVDLRRYDSEGHLYALEGTDGCDMIHTETGERLNHITFHNKESEMLRQSAMSDNKEGLAKYEAWYNKVVEDLPGVYHYSWFDISRKIKLYKGYWTRHWNSLYNKSLEDTATSNMMFDLPWSQVTDDMIEKRAIELKEGTGGWIWHRKWDGRNIPHVKIRRPQPSIMSEK